MNETTKAIRDGGLTDPAATVFVGGPIQHAVTKVGFDRPLQELIEMVIALLERGGFRVFSAHLAEHFGSSSHEFSSDCVTRRDYDWMCDCDVYVAILPLRNSFPYRSDGTHVEIGWASAMRRPVVIIGDVPLEDGYSHLVRGLRQITTVAELDAGDVQRFPNLLIDGINELLQANRLPAAGYLSNPTPLDPATVCLLQRDSQNSRRN